MSPFVVTWIGGRPEVEPGGRGAWRVSGQAFQVAVAADRERHGWAQRDAGVTLRATDRGSQ